MRGLARGHAGQPATEPAGDRPDLLLTTPESLEAMLISSRTRASGLFGSLRSVVVDEIHAFAGDDRGWHLLAVLERLARLAGRPLQRVGLSATVGNPADLLRWLQGAPGSSRPGVVLGPEPSTGDQPDLALDFVGSIENAATVIAALHRGEKRLVFCDSRRRVEELATALHQRGVETFVSHSSLSSDQRRRSERAFAEARDCVIVATSTLELGIDVGDLDRVIQVDAPPTVAAVTQRLGRTGRRAGGSRNCLFLATDRAGLLHAAALLWLRSRDWIESIVAPPSPLHIVAQQILALALQQGRIGQHDLRAWLPALPIDDGDVDTILHHLLDGGFLDTDDGMLIIGQQGERTFGRRHFMELTSVFTSDRRFSVLHGRTEIGNVDAMALAARREGTARLLLGGMSWIVAHVDWSRRVCHVNPSKEAGSVRWPGSPQVLSAEVAGAMREVVLGASPGATLSQRAVTELARAGRPERFREARGERGIARQRWEDALVDVGRRWREHLARRRAVRRGGRPRSRREPVAAAAAQRNGRRVPAGRSVGAIASSSSPGGCRGGGGRPQVRGGPPPEDGGRDTCEAPRRS